MVPKLNISLPTCLLRVVDNDSGEELTRISQKVAPNNLKKNKVLPTKAPIQIQVAVTAPLA